LRVVRRWFDDLDVAQITTEEVGAYTQHRFGKGISGTTVRKELGALKAALNWCANKQRNPRLLTYEDVPFIALPDENPPRTNWLRPDEAERMFGLAANRAGGNEHFNRRRIGLFLCIALETGSRQAAIRDLTWSRVDFATGLIDLRDPHQIATNKRRVQIPMSDKLRPVLESAFARRDPNNSYVLGHSGAVRTSFNNFIAEHGFDCTPHDLRRTWATLRVMWGAPLDVVAELLGDTTDVVRKHYAQFQPGYGRDVMNLGGGV
jgi:integrase